MKRITITLTEDQFQTLFEFVWEERERLKDVIKPDPKNDDLLKITGFKNVRASNMKKFSYMTRLLSSLHEQEQRVNVT